MTPQLGEIWVYLSASPLLGLTMTLLAYQGATWLNRRCGGHPLANPVLLAVAALVALLGLTGTSYQTYFDGAQFVHFLLGPATVALAIPLYAQFDRLKRLALPLFGALLVGSLTAALSAVAIGGLPSLTAILVIATGILGAMGASFIYRALKIGDDAVRGFALGIASHGIGTARAFQESEQAGAFAALAMGLNGLMTALLLPVVMPWVMG